MKIIHAIVNLKNKKHGWVNVHYALEVDYNVEYADFAQVRTIGEARKFLQGERARLHAKKVVIEFKRN